MKKYGVPNNIAYFRMKAGLTQQQLGEMIGYEGRTICHYETGKRDIFAKTALEIADILNVTIIDLLCAKISAEEFIAVKSEFFAKAKLRGKGAKT